MNNRVLAILAAFGATTFYGLNHTVAKVVMPHHISPSGFIMLRLLGALILFFGVSFFIPKEKIDRKDYLRIFCAPVLGMCINMLSFFKGLELSTPINSAVMVTVSPMIVFILSAFFLREYITFSKFLGIVLGFGGALTLILYNKTNVDNAPNVSLGNILFFLNSVSFAGYLVVVKPLTQKYHTITLMKWMFLIGLVITFPFTIKEFSDVSWIALPWEAIWRMGFVVIGATFLTYLLNVYALGTLSATTLGVFIYLQPLIAIGYALLTGNDQLDGVKAFACFLVFAGVYLVSKKQTARLYHSTKPSFPLFLIKSMRKRFKRLH